MDSYTVFPDKAISGHGPVAAAFLKLDIGRFLEACRCVHELPYGYNSNMDDPMILFREKQGTCTTKHAVIGLLAAELDIPVVKTMGIYAMTESIVSGTRAIVDRFDLPYVPMIHCFLRFGSFRVDLTEGNANGKNRSLETFLHTEDVRPDIPERNEYLRYRAALKELVQNRKELQGVDLKRLLKAREEGLKLLKEKIRRQLDGSLPLAVQGRHSGPNV
ncbi:MAG: hypothetical protein ACOWWM_04210 [Desulfobacterales bacterium]